MRRIPTAALASSLLALALPAAASAHHASRHDAAHRASPRHHHRRRHAHTVLLAPSAKRAGVSGTEPPVTPSEPVAIVASFENGVLKMSLPDGSTVSGKVNEGTEIQCPGQDIQGEEHGFGHDQGDDDGPGHDQGDDNQGEDQGEDHPGDLHGDDEHLQQGEGSCGVSSLVPGAKVEEAELSVSGAGAFWEKVELFPAS